LAAHILTIASSFWFVLQKIDFYQFYPFFCRFMPSITESTRGVNRIRLINAAGIGRVTLDSDGAPVEIAEIYADKPPLFFESN
jgi:hypothetical protein